MTTHAMTGEQDDIFADRAALIVGGGRNIGREIALEFGRRGARVAVADRDFEGAVETAAMIAAAGGPECAIACDVTSDESVRGCVAAAEAALGPIDILVNNAGILSGGNPEDIPVAAWQRMMDVNFFGMVRAIELLMPGMIARGRGHIVNTASFAGTYPFASSRIHYAASKAAVLSMSQNLALYLHPKGVKVSCLVPGPVMTTSNLGMTHYSDDYVMRGPGSGLWVKSQAEVAALLADGMAAGRILIPTHEEVWQTLVDWAASPDAFIERKAAEFAAGDAGRPQLPDHLRP